MKKIIATLLLTVSFLAFSSLAQAQGNSQVVRQNKAPETNSQQTRLKEVFNRVFDKFDTRLSRYGSFITKLESRRAKLAESGADVSELDNAIRLFKIQLGETRGAVNTAKSNLSNLDYSLSTRELVQAFKSEINTVRESFRKLHQTAVNAVTQAKSISK